MGNDFKQPVSFNHLLDDSDKGEFKGSDIRAAPVFAAVFLGWEGACSVFKQAYAFSLEM